MSALLAHGRLLDWIFAGMFLEALALVALHQVTGRFLPPKKLLPNLASGMCLLLAMRLALAGAGFFAPAALLGALVFHVIDLIQRQS
jgi:hypothetical protein